LSGASERSLAEWESGRKEPGEAARRRLEELQRLHAALAGVLQEGSLPQWVSAPNPGFGGLKPLEVVERAETDRLWRMIFRLESGNPV